MVAQCFLQKYGEDYNETFPSVMSYTKIKVFLCAVAYKKLKVNHIGMKSAVIMTQAGVCITPGEVKKKAGRLNKANYSQIWHVKKGWILCQVYCEEENTPYIMVYVEDLLIEGQD